MTGALIMCSSCRWPRLIVQPPLPKVKDDADRELHRVFRWRFVWAVSTAIQVFADGADFAIRVRPHDPANVGIVFGQGLRILTSRAGSSTKLRKSKKPISGEIARVAVSSTTKQKTIAPTAAIALLDTLRRFTQRLSSSQSMPYLPQAGRNCSIRRPRRADGEGKLKLGRWKDVRSLPWRDQLPL